MSRSACAQKWTFAVCKHWIDTQAMVVSYPRGPDVDRCLAECTVVDKSTWKPYRFIRAYPSCATDDYDELDGLLKYAQTDLEDSHRQQPEVRFVRQV